MSSASVLCADCAVYFYFVCQFAAGYIFLYLSFSVESVLFFFRDKCPAQVFHSDSGPGCCFVYYRSFVSKCLSCLKVVLAFLLLIIIPQLA